MTTAADVIVDTARRGELHHAIILFGPAPDELRKLSVRIAKALNCLNGSGGDDCEVCRRIDQRLHPDVHFVEVAGERKLISIEQIRELVSEATLRPYEGRNKVFIIDPADALSVSGSNSLLKTLEEPARDTTFLLLTRSADLLLQTVLSRSQKLYVAGEVETDAKLAASIESALEAFAKRRDVAALLSLAAIVGGEENASDAMALLASILTRLAAAEEPPVARERLLAAADAVLAAIRSLQVNADVRLVLEGALARLVV
jgi:DNA polymerase-3 subunit delta'